HSIHVHRADAKRGESELCRVRESAQTDQRTHLHVLRDGGRRGRSRRGSRDHSDSVQKPRHAEHRRNQFTQELMQNLWIIPALPFLGFLINGIFGRKLPKAVINTVAIASVLLSFGWVLKVFMSAGDLAANPVNEHYFTWIKSGEFEAGWDFGVDKLTMIMLFV